MNDCKLYGSRVCENLNVKHNGVNCRSCPFGNIKADEAEEIMSNYAVTQSLLPEGGIDWMKHSDECFLCKGEKRKTSCYGTINIGHEDPPSHKRMLFGLGKKVRTKIGSMIPVNFASCSKCRRNHSILSGIQFIMTVCGILIGFLLIMIPPVRVAIETLFAGASFMFIVLLAVVALLLSGFIRTGLQKKMEKDTIFDLKEIEAFKKIFARGWFLIDGNRGAESILFSRKPSAMNFDPVKQEEEKESE